MLAAPSFALAYAVVSNLPISFVTTTAFLFGGLMFGPDLDTFSKQYARWSIFRGLWYPYRSIFKHRSRWSHGLIFGTLFRVIYCLGVITVVMFLALFAAAILSGGKLPDIGALTATWHDVGKFTRENFGDSFFPAVFIGMWIGAASHTFTDMAGSYVKTGRVTEFL